MKYGYSCDTPFGRLYLAADENGLTNTGFSAPLEALPEKELPIFRAACQQLSEYFAGLRKVFHLPLAPQGTPFQKKVWSALLDIPYGNTTSYQDIARTVGNEKACRAVGMANNKNPIGIIIPCHRVVGKNGRLTGYAGGLDIKEKLLRLEGALK